MRVFFLTFYQVKCDSENSEKNHDLTFSSIMIIMIPFTGKIALNWLDNTYVKRHLTNVGEENSEYIFIANFG